MEGYISGLEKRSRSAITYVTYPDVSVTLCSIGVELVEWRCESTKW